MTKYNQSFKTRDGCQLVYEIKGEGLPLVLIHGWTFDRKMWWQQVTELSQHFTTITYDRRGCGESEGPPDLSKETDDLTDLLNHLAIDSAYIVGMSQGGRVALRYYITHPEKVKALVLQGAPLDGYVPKTNHTDQIPLEHFSKLVMEGQIKTVREEWMQHPLMHIPSPNPSVKRQARRIINRYTGKDLIENMTERMEFPINISEKLDQITIPTLIIEGSEEIPLLKEIANVMLKGIHNSKKIVINGGGHLINFIAPEKYNQAVIDFLKK